MAKAAARTKKATPPPVADPELSPREPSNQEIAAMLEAANRVRGRRPAFKTKSQKNEDGSVSISPDHSDEKGWYFRFLDAFGTGSEDFAVSTLNGLGNGMVAENGVALNAALAVVDGLRPRDEIEAMLAAQMAVTHSLAMELLTRAKRAEFVPQFDAAGNLAVKLLRTYTAQVEALAKLRRGGEQTVRVEHVHVYPGGQAVVGNLTTAGQPGGGGDYENATQPHAPDDARALAFASGSPLWSADAERNSMPLAVGEGQEAVPDARRRTR